MIELLVGLALMVGLALALAPLLVSLERVGTENADRSVQVVQSRVAIGRFERDMRLADGTGCPFPSSALLLEASRKRVVAVLPGGVDATPLVVAWEVTGGNLMRRWGVCPADRPATLTNSLFVDHKTMLEGVGAGSGFTYSIGRRVVGPSPDARTLAAVDTVRLDLILAPAGIPGTTLASTTARVGR